MLTYLRCVQCFNFFQADEAALKLCSDRCFNHYLDRAIIRVGGAKRK